MGNKVFETSRDGENLRVLVDNSQIEISSIDYDYSKNTFYLADNKNSKVKNKRQEKAYLKKTNF